MPKSKQRKNHKKKLAARKTKLENENKRAKKAQTEFLMNLIKQEQEKGAFDDTVSMDEGPSIEGLLEGPSI